MGGIEAGEVCAGVAGRLVQPGPVGLDPNGQAVPPHLLHSSEGGVCGGQAYSAW